MEGLWVTMKESIKCTRSKLTDVSSCRPKELCRKLWRRCPCGNENELLTQREYSLQEVFFRGTHINHRRSNIEPGNSVPIVLFKPISERKNKVELHQTPPELLFRPNHPITVQFHEINIGDPSRKIIEKIFEKGLINPSKHSRKIKRVFKVKNSAEIHERFEKYRDKVKKKAYEKRYVHPRSSVDGNEMLRFYGTVMTCSERSTQVSAELCNDPFCRVCRILQSSFDNQHSKMNGIRLSTCSEEFCDNMAALTKFTKAKKAVIVCRTIAGEVTNIVDEAFGKCDSFRSRERHPYSEYLTVKNPCALLPCFVIVFT